MNAVESRWLDPDRPKKHEFSKYLLAKAETFLLAGGPNIFGNTETVVACPWYWWLEVRGKQIG